MAVLLRLTGAFEGPALSLQLFSLSALQGQHCRLGRRQEAAEGSGGVAHVDASLL